MALLRPEGRWRRAGPRLRWISGQMNPGGLSRSVVFISYYSPDPDSLNVRKHNKVILTDRFLRGLNPCWFGRLRLLGACTVKLEVMRAACTVAGVEQLEGGSGSCVLQLLAEETLMKGAGLSHFTAFHINVPDQRSFQLLNCLTDRRLNMLL